jgi:hypothetical protein
MAMRYNRRLMPRSGRGQQLAFSHCQSWNDDYVAARIIPNAHLHIAVGRSTAAGCKDPTQENLDGAPIRAGRSRDFVGVLALLGGLGIESFIVFRDGARLCSRIFWGMETPERGRVAKAVGDCMGELLPRGLGVGGPHAHA